MTRTGASGTQAASLRSASARRARALAAVGLASACALAGASCAPASAQAFAFGSGGGGLSVSVTEAGGAQARQAGSHPYAMTTALAFEREGGGGTAGDLRDLMIEEPPGLIENPAAVPQCTPTDFGLPRNSPFEESAAGESCPADTQIGTLTVESSAGGGGARTFGIFNLAPAPGAPSELGAAPYGAPIVFTPRIRQAAGGYGITLEARNVSQVVDLYGLTLNIWGTPWDVRHDTERGNCLNEQDPEAAWGKCSAGRPLHNQPLAYLSLPPSCAAPLLTRVAADSWQDPGARLPDGEPNLADPAWVSAAAASPALAGCDALHFEPSARARTTTARASSPSGFDLSFQQPSEGLTDPVLDAPSQPEKAVVTLPEGMTLNPSLAAGLGVCTPAQYAAESATSPPGVGCPDAAKIGDVSVRSPLFAAPITGSVFLAEPNDQATGEPGAENPFDALLALYIVASSPERGIVVKLAGKVDLNQGTGRPTATFEGLPQLPYSSFEIDLREGQRSPLLTPSACGNYTSRVDFSPWLAPTATFSFLTRFAVDEGIEGSACPGGGAAPFAPTAAGGDLSSQAGAYTPFYLRLARKDTEQEITSYSATLPPGLLGKIAGIPYCPEADIEAAREATGTEEQEHPSCPAASQIGRTYSGYGVGSVLAYAPGRLYLAGPYHGSAFSVVAIDSATVGPFDLGTIIVRSAIELNPHDAQVSIDSAASDPIPHILDGIPIHLRDVRVYLDRPETMLNPTSCDPAAISSTMTGSAAPFTDPRDVSATAGVPFQVTNCSALGYRPRFSLRLSSARHGAFPTLTATFRPRPGDANTAAAVVALPPSEFLEQAHIKAVCPRSRLESEACPSAAVYGRSRALTPLLSEPMEGPVYLVSSRSGKGLPELVAVLHGQGIRILVEGRIDTYHHGIRATFTGLPDAPVGSFTFTVFGGRRRGLLVNAATTNLCRAARYATARFLGQDNDGEALRTRLTARCGGNPKHRHGQSPHRRKGGRRQ